VGGISCHYFYRFSTFETVSIAPGESVRFSGIRKVLRQPRRDPTDVSIFPVDREIM
jgi:hypothetical protein